MSAVSERLAWAIKRTSVPAHIRSLLEHLPQPLVLEADINLARLPHAGLQLLRLAQAQGPWTMGRVDAEAEVTLFTVKRGDKRMQLEPALLKKDLLSVVNAMVGALFAPDELPALLERLAYQSSTLATLQTLTSHMLQTRAVDRALHIMLSGVTSGQSLGFNRAVLFEVQADGRFAGSIAVGPFDEAEAHHVWEAMEVGEVTVEDLVANMDAPPREGRLQRMVSTLEWTLHADAADEFALTQREGRALLFEAAPVHPALRALSATPPFVVAQLRAHDGSLGFVFADNRFSRTPVNQARLDLLRFYMDQTALVWQNLRLLKQVEDLAQLDGLTGVYNRRALDERVDQGIQRDARGRRPAAMLLVDLDHFKEVNDQRGHAAGDVALKTLAGVLARGLRTTDVLGRYGGDEFVAYLSDITLLDLRHAVERMGREARAAGISVSIGAAHAAVPGTAAELFAAADRNLYAAKNHGRGCAVVDGVGLVRFG